MNDYGITIGQRKWGGERCFGVIAPYTEQFRKVAPTIGGKWNSVSKQWIFPYYNLEKVNEYLSEIYGLGSKPVTIRLTITTVDSRRKALAIGGLTIVERISRDRDVVFGEGVTLIDGGFPSSGGSARYPVLDHTEPVLLEIRNVPYSLVHDLANVEIINEKPSEIDQVFKTQLLEWLNSGSHSLQGDTIEDLLRELGE